MLAYENLVINRTGVFPNTTAKNASSSSASDGTEYVAGLINQEWGFFQYLAQAAGQTPNGAVESASASQIYTMLQMCFSAPGEYVFDDIPPQGSYGSATIAYGGTLHTQGDVPAMYLYRRVIACQGQALLIANYPNLAAAIYCGDANNATAAYNYKATTSVNPSSNRSTSGTYIVIPDFRGVTLRGYDPTPVRDPGGATRGLLASLQQDAMQGHYHQHYTVNAGFGSSNNVVGQNGNTSAGDGSGVRQAITDGTHGTPRIDSETRMYNVSVNAGIRF